MSSKEMRYLGSANFLTWKYVTAYYSTVNWSKSCAMLLLRPGWPCYTSRMLRWKTVTRAGWKRGTDYPNPQRRLFRPRRAGASHPLSRRRIVANVGKDEWAACFVSRRARTASPAGKATKASSASPRPARHRTTSSRGSSRGRQDAGTLHRLSTSFISSAAWGRGTDYPR